MWSSIFTYGAICTNEGFATKTNSAWIVLALLKGGMKYLLKEVISLGYFHENRK